MQLPQTVCAKVQSNAYTRVITMQLSQTVCAKVQSNAYTRVIICKFYYVFHIRCFDEMKVFHFILLKYNSFRYVV